MENLLSTLSAFDGRLLNIMRSWIDPDLAWLRTLIHLFADSQVVLVAFFLLGLWIYGVMRSSRDYRRESLLIFYGIAVSFVVYIVLNLGLPMRARPETVLAIRPIIDHLPDNSFPSGHAIFAMASSLSAYFFLSVGRRFWVPVLFVLGILMCFSRIFAGVHYPLDIACGYALGSIGPLIVRSIASHPLFDRIMIAPVIALARFFRL